jgi:predicted RNase H-like HicB family nuclease
MEGFIMVSTYPACFFKEDNVYSVVFPDLNWLATSGNTEIEAMNNAVECLAGYLYMLKVDNDTIPSPSSIKDINLKSVAKELDADARDAFVNLVSVDIDVYAEVLFEKSVRKSLTIPYWMNMIATQKGINFSQTLQEALLEKIKE